MYKIKSDWVSYIEEKEQLKKYSLLDSNHTDLKTDKNLISSDFALKPNIFPILGGIFVNNVYCQSNHFFKT